MSVLENWPQYDFEDNIELEDFVSVFKDPSE